MNIKELENQLTFKLGLEIGLTIVVWVLIVFVVGYRLWQAGKLKEQPLTIMNNVPTIKQADLDILRGSIKADLDANFEKMRPEPFDDNTSIITN